MYKIYDPLNGFKVVGRALSISEAFAIAKSNANATKREQWIDDQRGIFAGVAKPALACR